MILIGFIIGLLLIGFGIVIGLVLGLVGRDLAENPSAE